MSSFFSLLPLVGQFRRGYPPHFAPLGVALLAGPRPQPCFLQVFFPSKQAAVCFSLYVSVGPGALPRIPKVRRVWLRSAQAQGLPQVREQAFVVFVRLTFQGVQHA
jgi:hypothetical protein